MAWVFVAIATLSVVGAAFVGEQYASTIRPVWSPAMSLFEVARILSIGLIAWGLWNSGRGSLQIAAVVLFAFAGLWIAMERLTDNE